MSVLFKLPGDLCYEIITEWVSTFHWGLLDLALCNTNLRNCLLDLWKKMHINSCENYSSVSFYKWIYERNFKTLEIYVAKALFQDEECEHMLCSIRAERVTFLKIHKDLVVSKKVTEFIDSCTNAKELTVFNSSVFLSLNESTLSKLTVLYCLCEQTQSNRSNLEFIASHCRSLKTFCFKAAPLSTFTPLYETIFRNNSQLESISLPLLVKDFALVKLHCKHMKTIDVIGSIYLNSIIPLFCDSTLLKLKTLTCDNFEYAGNVLNFSCMDEPIYDPVTLIQSLKNLESIHCSMMSIPALLSVVAHSSTLTLLDIRCGQISAVSLGVVLKSCRNLTDLSIVGPISVIEEGSFLEIFEAFPNSRLEKLTFTDVVPLEVKTFLGLWLASPQLIKCIIDVNLDDDDKYDLLLMDAFRQMTPRKTVNFAFWNDGSCFYFNGFQVFVRSDGQQMLVESFE